MDPYADFLRKLFRLAGEIWFQRVETELWKFAEPFYAWLDDLFEHPKPRWRESFEAFLSGQQAEGRTLTPESKQATLDYLASWAATVDWAAAAHEPGADSNLAVLGPLEGAMIGGTSHPPPGLEFDTRVDLGLQALPESPRMPPDVREPELAPLVSSAT